MEKFEAPLEDLQLDLQNPRLVEAETQLGALKSLIDIGPGYFRTLMTSIKDNGLDPGDAFYVLADDEDETSFIVVDGNRRLAALRVLSEPSVLKGIGLTDAEVKMLTTAAAGYTPGTISDVECVLFDDRKSADLWIARRHGRDLGGEGRLVWGPLEIERFQRDHTNLDVIGFLERNTSIIPTDWAATKKAVENNSSSLNRFLSNKAFRKLIGLTVTTETDDSKVPYFTASPDIVLALLEKIFVDIRDKKINTRTYNTAEEIEGYIEQLPAKLKGEGKQNSTPQRFRDVNIAKPNNAAATKKTAASTTKTTQATRPRQTLAEKKHPFKQPETTKGQRLVYEASRLNTATYPLSAAYVLRAFIEHTVDTYMTVHSIPRQEGIKPIELHRRAETVIAHLIAAKTASGQDLRAAKRVLGDTKDKSSIQALNDYHHGRYVIPAADSLRAAWDACIPLFIAVYGSPS
ncbi:hypothetical protein ACQR50_16950 [Sphingomonas sp. Xoc002]|uniref:hypothetical protein n=1 Tax=Sphingomonas sp. Xoc002 TaxID=2837624 RepID=UPI003D178A9C